MKTTFHRSLVNLLVTGALTALTGCGNGDRGAVGTPGGSAMVGGNPIEPATWDGGCATVTEINPPPAPHAEPEDRFCVTFDGTNWIFEPGVGMDDIGPIPPATEIVMSTIVLSGNIGLWRFDARVDPHPPAGTHGNDHATPFNYQLFVNFVLGTAQLTVPGPPPSNLHGGIAHANLD